MESINLEEDSGPNAWKDQVNAAEIKSPVRNDLFLLKAEVFVWLTGNLKTLEDHLHEGLN
jgi:hypothetical protein